MATMISDDAHGQPGHEPGGVARLSGGARRGAATRRSRRTGRTSRRELDRRRTRRTRRRRGRRTRRSARRGSARTGRAGPAARPRPSGRSRSRRGRAATLGTVFIGGAARLRWPRGPPGGFVRAQPLRRALETLPVDGPSPIDREDARGVAPGGRSRARQERSASVSRSWSRWPSIWPTTTTLEDLLDGLLAAGRMESPAHQVGRRSAPAAGVRTVPSRPRSGPAARGCGSVRSRSISPIRIASVWSPAVAGRFGPIEDPLDLADPVRQHLRAMGEDLARPPVGLGLRPERLGERPRLAGLEAGSEGDDRRRSRRPGGRAWTRWSGRARRSWRTARLGLRLEAWSRLSDRRPVAVRPLDLHPGRSILTPDRRVRSVAPSAHSRALRHWRAASEAPRHDPDRPPVGCEGARRRTGSARRAGAATDPAGRREPVGRPRQQERLSPRRRTSCPSTASTTSSSGSATPARRPPTSARCGASRRSPTPASRRACATGPATSCARTTSRSCSPRRSAPDGEIAEHVHRHGDGVKDIAFSVDDAARVVARDDHRRGARSVHGARRARRRRGRRPAPQSPSARTARSATASSTGATTTASSRPATAGSRSRPRRPAG